MDLAAIGTVVKDLGLPVAIATGSLWALVKLGTWVYEKAEGRLDAKTKECAEERVRFEARIDAKEAAHAAERKALTDAYVAILNDIKTQIQQAAQSINTLGGAVSEIRGSLRRSGE